MKALLLTVTHRIQMKNGHLVLDPEFEHPGVSEQQDIKVTLKLPDGTSRVAEAFFELPIVNRHPYSPPGLVCLLHNMKKADVPVGTEVWLNAEIPDTGNTNA